MGQRLLSLKAGPAWAGVTNKTSSDRGLRGFLSIDGGYVSQDGQEIRMMPGYRTLIDLSEINNEEGGYHRYVEDAVLPVMSTTPAAPFQYYYDGTGSSKLSLLARAKPQRFHCFEQVGKTLFIIGESRFREQPIMDSSRNILSVAAVIITNPSTLWRIRMSANPAANSATDAAGAGLNGVRANDVVYCEGITVDDAVLQALLDSEVNGKIHTVNSVSTADIVLNTTSAGTAGSSAITTAGECHKVRPNRTDDYPKDAYAVSDYDRPDDPDALTCWRVHVPLSLVFDDPTDAECIPAWVANRQRDFGDDPSTSNPVEGCLVGSTVRGVSRREGREIPYRLNPTLAGNRIVMAAPGYNCLFEIPNVVPVDPDAWENSTAPVHGIPWWGNDIYDKPRSLGLPKARLIDSQWTPAPSSPTVNGTSPWNFNASAYTGSPEYGVPSGAWRMAITYFDDGSGEEGLPSEPVLVDIPANSHLYFLQISYMHPGYVMPECLATHINIYLAPPGNTNLQFYTSYALAGNGVGARDATLASAKYGFGAGFSPDNLGVDLMHRTLQIPLPADGSSLVLALDSSRPAPEFKQSFRGSEAAVYVRGVLVAVGSSGTVGGGLQLWPSKGSVIYSSDTDPRDVLLIRKAGSSIIEDGGNTSIDGGDGDGGFGIGNRAFPSAYQGYVDVVSNDLIPAAQRIQVDEVLNHKTTTLTGNANRYYERLSIIYDYLNRTRYATTPNSASINRTDQSLYYVMPQGQAQISDPGAPWRTNALATQLVDPAKDGDLTAAGQLSGRVVFCTRNESYYMSWQRDAGSEKPVLISNEFGCIAQNSMTEFDGGLAWISKRGPVALTSDGLSHVGSNVSHWFTSIGSRYIFDSRGMMRYSWGCHDSERGLVLWGGINTQSFLTIDGQNSAVNRSSPDEWISKAPCNEVLIWSYRSGAFSTWTPPSHLGGIVWMREIRDEHGSLGLAFLAGDGRIYQMADTCNDTNSSVERTLTGSGTASTALTLSSAINYDDGATGGADGRGSFDNFVAPGMTLELVNADDELVATTTVAAVTSTTTITAATALTWKNGYKVRIGARRLTLQSVFLGGETMDNFNVQKIQLRYSLRGSGSANALAQVYKTDLDNDTEPGKLVDFCNQSAWDDLGTVAQGALVDVPTMSRRRNFAKGDAQAPEISVKLTVTGTAQVRIADIALELAE